MDSETDPNLADSGGDDENLADAGATDSGEATNANLDEDSRAGELGVDADEAAIAGDSSEAVAETKPGRRTDGARASAASPREELQLETLPRAPPPVKETLPYDFLYKKDKYIPPISGLPDDSELALAKAFLKTNSERSEMNLYDHLTVCLMRVLETRPKNAVDIFESLSIECKKSGFRAENADSPGALQKVPDTSLAAELAKIQIKLFERPLLEDGSGEHAPIEPPSGEIPDIMDISHLWEWGGLTLGSEETFLLFLSLKQLVEEKSLKSVRLWGKIFGLKSNYIIIEGELREGTIDEEDAVVNGTLASDEAPQEEAEQAAPSENAAANPEGSTNPEDEEGAPKPKNKVIPPLPKEMRTGVNKYIYYVTPYPGGPWTRLPDVIPEKMQIARKIRKYFTGDLAHKIISYPAFDATEAQYLRCQIARISGATVVSPAGYYIFDPEEADGEDLEHNTSIIINPEYEGQPNEALLNPANWVHHVPYILPQGRVTWENPLASLKKEGNEGEEDEEDGGSDAGSQEDNEEAPQPEAGPPILSPLSGDEDHGDIPAWTSRICSTLSPPKFTPVVMRSTRWPGAAVVAFNDKFTNIYVGDGLKDLGNPVQHFIPPKLPEIQSEYTPLGAEITEQVDPTVEEEKAYEEALKAKLEEKEEEEEAAEGEAEEGDD